MIYARALSVQLVFWTCLLGSVVSVDAQYTGYSLKFGPTMALQSWDGFDQSPLFGYHVDLQVESLSDEQPRTLYAALGYHQRGSAIRSRAFTTLIQGREERFRAETINFLFHNVALALGAKQTSVVGSFRGHISLALRGEVNVGTDLGGEIAERRNNFGVGIPYPVDEFVNRFVAGVDVGAGLDFPLSPSLDALVEIRVSPDFTRQYFQPPVAFNPIINGVRGDPTFTAERTISNVSIELSVGLRLVRFPLGYYD